MSIFPKFEFSPTTFVMKFVSKQMENRSIFVRCFSLPEIEEIQSRHGFQHGKLVRQQPEDHGDPVYAAHHLQHVPLIANLTANRSPFNPRLTRIRFVFTRLRAETSE